MAERDRKVGEQVPIDAGKPNTGLRVLAIFKEGHVWVPHRQRPGIFRRVDPHRQTTE